MKFDATVAAVLAATCVAILQVEAVRTRPSPAPAAPEGASPAPAAQRASPAPAATEALESNATEGLELTEDVFVPACGDHLTVLIDRLRASYTAVQMPTVFGQWCSGANYTHRFRDETACSAFSTLLTEAYHQTLANSSAADGFPELCTKYYKDEVMARTDNGAWAGSKGEDPLPKAKNATAALEECSNKMKKIMGRLHKAYTYDQLPEMLMNACQGRQKFSGQEHKKYCTKLVQHLMMAHEEEIEGKDQEQASGYSHFCQTHDLADSPLLELIAVAESASVRNASANASEPSVAAMRLEAQTRRLRADGSAASSDAAVATTINADAGQLLNFLVHPDHAAEHAEHAELDSASVATPTSDSGHSPVALPSLDDFVAACLSHTKKLMKDLPESYTEVQLPAVLSHACELDEDIHGFNDAAACQEFANALVKAHSSSNREEGYVAFCRDYYVHKGGVINTPKVEELKEEPIVEPARPANKSVHGIVAILGIITAIVVAGTVVNLKNRH